MKSVKTTKPLASDCCAVCGLADTRALTAVRLEAARVLFCGTHALMYRRLRVQARTVAEVRQLLRDRRDHDRRADEVDELAAQLTAAFAGERRATDRRTG